MPNEVELKLRIAAEDLMRLRRHPAIRRHLTEKPVTRRLVSIYYDTPDLQLLNKKTSLRVRRMSNRWFQAVKCSGHALAGLHQRGEWEDIIAKGAPDFTKILDPALIKVFADQALRDALQPIFVTDVKRTEWQLAYDNGTEIEVALDLGQLEVNNKSEPISEVELELKKGKTVRLFELAALLQKTIPLHIENISKAERGYRHYHTQQQTHSQAKPCRLTTKTSPAQAFQAIAWECLRQMQANEALVMLNDVEATHQMHIAVRRLKVAFKLFKFKHNEIIADINWLNALLGSARDLDILATETLQQVFDQSEHYDQLAQLVERKQQLSYVELQKAINSQQYQRMLLNFGVELSKKTNASERSCNKLIGRKLRDTYKRLPWDNKKLSDISETALHDVRIKIKRLRYTLEFFRQALTIKLPINDILCLQKNMGLLNDARISKQLLIPIIKKMPLAAEKSLIDQFNAWEDNLTKQTLKLMQPSWKKLRRKNSV